jgi:hypothetical protein
MIGQQEILTGRIIIEYQLCLSARIKGFKQIHEELINLPYDRKWKHLYA